MKQIYATFTVDSFTNQLQQSESLKTTETMETSNKQATIAVGIAFFAIATIVADKGYVDVHNAKQLLALFLKACVFIAAAVYSVGVAMNRGEK